jgi:hypothetical protein
MIATACDGHDAPHTRATHLLIVATIVTGRGCGLPTVLLAPLLTAVGMLPGIMDDDIGQCFPTASRVQVKLGRLIVDGVLGVDVV